MAPSTGRRAGSKDKNPGAGAGATGTSANARRAGSKEKAAGGGSRGNGKSVSERRSGGKEGARGAGAHSEALVVAGRRPVLELLKAGRAADRVLVATGLAPSSIIGDIRRRADAAGIPVRNVPREEIDRIAPGVNHQGVAAYAGRYRYASLDDLLRRDSPTVLFLDGVTDPHNLGSLLRSAAAAEVSGVVIPARRAADVTPAVRRVSAGASEWVPVARVGNLSAAIDRARSKGVWVLGLDSEAEVDLWSSNLAEPPVGLVLGSEDRGLSPSVKGHCDALARIPCSPRVPSLNVAVAGAIAMFHVVRRRQMEASQGGASVAGGRPPEGGSAVE